MWLPGELIESELPRLVAVFEEGAEEDKNGGLKRRGPAESSPEERAEKRAAVLGKVPSFGRGDRVKRVIGVRNRMNFLTGDTVREYRVVFRGTTNLPVWVDAKTVKTHAMEHIVNFYERETVIERRDPRDRLFL